MQVPTKFDDNGARSHSFHDKLCENMGIKKRVQRIVNCGRSEKELEMNLYQRTGRSHIYTYMTCNGFTSVICPISSESQGCASLSGK
jgi:hypothetical protein